jgi:N-acetylglutamate synthase/N-acetylornithine aminotransferase
MIQPDMATMLCFVHRREAARWCDAALLKKASTPSAAQRWIRYFHL